jgi:hypothetical protein
MLFNSTQAGVSQPPHEEPPRASTNGQSANSANGHAHTTTDETAAGSFMPREIPVLLKVPSNRGTVQVGFVCTQDANGNAKFTPSRDERRRLKNGTADVAMLIEARRNKTKLRGILDQLMGLVEAQD